MHRAREPHADAEQAARVHAGRLQHALDELGRLLDARVGVVVVRHLAPLLGEQLVGEVGERDGQVALAEVDADREAGARIERDQRGRAAAAGGGGPVGVAVDDHALGLEAGDDRRDGRARQAGLAREVARGS